MSYLKQEEFLEVQYFLFLDSEKKTFKNSASDQKPEDLK